MQILANGERRFYSFMGFYVMHLKYQGVKKNFDHSTNFIVSTHARSQLYKFYTLKHISVEISIPTEVWRSVTL